MDEPSSVCPLTRCLSLPRRRISCEEALGHSWIAEPISADPSTTKCLSKEKMKRYLARQKWKVGSGFPTKMTLCILLHFSSLIISSSPS